MIFSISKIRVFNECRKAYYYKYILNEDILRKNNTLEIGELLHYALYEYILNYSNYSEKDDKEVKLSLCKIALEKTNNFYIKNDIFTILQNLNLNLIRPDKETKSHELEKHILFNITDQISIEGVVDRIDIKDSENKICDVFEYKKCKNNGLEETYKIQASVYKYILENNGYTVNSVKFVYLTENLIECLDVSNCKKYMDMFVSDAHNVINEKYFPARKNIGFICNRCNLKSQCFPGKS